jgi:hypothetical protein
MAVILDKENDAGTFQVMHAFLRTLEKAPESEILKHEKEVRRCVILAIKTGSVINFEELQDLTAIRALTGVSEWRHNFLIGLVQQGSVGSAQLLHADGC